MVDAGTQLFEKLTLEIETLIFPCIRIIGWTERSYQQPMQANYQMLSWITGLCRHS